MLHGSNDGKHDGNQSTIIIKGIPQAAFQTLLLLVLTALVTVFYERGKTADQSLIAMQQWSINTFPCLEATPTAHHVCTNLTNTHHHCEDLLICNLADTAPFFQRNSKSGLFTAVGVPFLILCSQVIATAFFLGYVRHDSKDNTHSSTTTLQKNLKRISLSIQLIFGCSFLFLQNTWKIPGDNLFLGELLLLMCIFYISFHPSSHYSHHARANYIPTRFLEFVFTLPLLSVACTAACGLSDTDDTNWVFFSSVLLNLFVLCMEFNNHNKMHEETEPAQYVLLLNAWLCLAAYCMECGIVLDRAGAEQQRPWAIAALILMILYQGLYLLTVSIFQVFIKDQKDLFVLMLDVLGMGGKGMVCITLMGGALSALEP